MPLLSSFSFMVNLGLPNPGNGDTHNGQLSTLIKVLQTYQWAFFQVIRDCVKLIVKNNHSF